MKRFFKGITRCRLNNDQVGAASIYVSMMIMVILSLIVFTFSRIAINNYRQVAESQYDLQAYYAAEAAINDVRAAIHDNIRQTNKIYGADTELTVKAKRTLSGSSSFGSAVFVSRNLLFVGAPDQNEVSIVIKDASDFDWSSPASLSPVDISKPYNDGLLTASDRFGTSVFVGGGYLFVGAPDADDGRGAVYVFDSRGWTFKSKISNDTDPTKLSLSEGAHFGSAVAFDGSILFVGTPGAGKVFSFLKNGDDWDYKANPLSGDASERFGATLFVNDRNLVVGAPEGYDGKGQIDIYSKLDDSWDFTDTNKIEIYNKSSAKEKNNVPTKLSPGDNFGSSVSMHGSLLAVGAPGYDSDDISNSGAVHIFEKEGSGWYWKHHISQEVVTDPAVQTQLTNLISNAGFGQGVSLDGNLLAVGAPGTGTGMSKVYFFDVETNDILNDILASDLSQDCPDQEDAHPAWRNGTLLGGEDGDIRYLCVSVDVAPLELIYDRVDLDRSLLLQLQPVDENDDEVKLKQVTIEWAHADKGLGFDFDDTADPKFNTAAGWGTEKIPVLRVQVIVINTDMPYNRQNLKDNSKVFFLYPTDNNNVSTAVDWTIVSLDGSIIGGDCNSGLEDRHLPCRSVITLPQIDDIQPQGGLSDNQLTYLLRIQSIYNKARVVIKGKYTNNDFARFKNLQAIITATGRSSHVSERIRERIPLRPIYDLPEYAIDSAEDLCKILVATDSTGVYLLDEGDYKDLKYRTNENCRLTK